MTLLGLMIRFGERVPADAGRDIRAAALAFRFWTDEPGQTSMTYASENHQLTFHTAEILAGQLFPNQTFQNNGKNGVWHRARGEALARQWLQKRFAYGMDEWDANGYLAADLAILSHLRLAQNAELKDGATQIMHKILLGIALGSWRGSYGVAHARTQGEYIKDARRESVANFGRLMWGVGAWNHGIGSAVAVAISDYELPPAIREIALDAPAAMWSRQRQGLPAGSAGGFNGPVNTVAFKTPDFLLASVQSFKAGESGENQQQQIWQATLGPEASVWVNHPACVSENGNRRPNFWMGQATFPRVAQWQSTLVAVHRMRQGDWLGWTHAYFPTFAFDEWKLSGEWAFARVGEGYLALRAKNGLHIIEGGKSAWRELRSQGRENVWLCLMGRRATDGDFSAFQTKITALPISFDGPDVKMSTLRGETLSFGWTGAFLVAGKEQPIQDFPHFDTPYVQAPWPAETLEIKRGGQTLSLDFGQRIQ